MRVSKVELIQALPVPEFKKVRVKQNQTANDIIKELVAAEQLYREQYKIIAEKFRGVNARESARNVWEFLKSSLNYKIEGDSWQTSKSPAVLLSQGYGDCKHYSLFSMGILRSLGYTCVFRFASYKISDPTPQHVYLMIKLESGQWLPVDAVWKEFGTEKEFFHKKDIEPMSLYRISGFDDDGSFGKLPRRELLKRVVKGSPAGLLAAKLKNKRKIRVRAVPVVSGYYEHDEEAVGKLKLGKALKKLGKGVAKVAKKTGKGVAKATKKVGKGVAKAAKGAVKAVVKIAATPARNAFLALVGLNFKGLGYKMNKAIVKDPNKVKDFWVKKFKGNWNSLLKAVARGAKKGKKYTPGQIGDGGASFLVVAGPILIAAMGLLSSILGKKEAEENGDISEGVDKEMLNDKDIMEQLKDPTKLAENISTAVTAAMQSSTPYRSGTDFDTEQVATAPIDSGGGGEGGGGGAPEEKDNTMLYVGGAAIAAAFLLK